MRLPARHNARLRGGSAAGASTGKINVTPLIDVVMCLIVFYLIVAKLASDRQLPLDLPGAQQGIGDEANAPIIISIAPGSRGVLVEVHGELVDADSQSRQELVRDAVARAASERPDAPVHLRADRTLAYAEVRPVIEACRQAGVRTLLLVASREDAPIPGGTP